MNKPAVSVYIKFLVRPHQPNSESTVNRSDVEPFLEPYFVKPGAIVRSVIIYGGEFSNVGRNVRSVGVNAFDVEVGVVKNGRPGEFLAVKIQSQSNKAIGNRALLDSPSRIDEHVCVPFPMVKGTSDSIQNPFYKALALEVNNSGWIGLAMDQLIGHETGRVFNDEPHGHWAATPFRKREEAHLSKAAQSFWLAGASSPAKLNLLRVWEARKQRLLNAW